MRVLALDSTDSPEMMTKMSKQFVVSIAVLCSILLAAPALPEESAVPAPEDRVDWLLGESDLLEWLSLIHI